MILEEGAVGGGEEEKAASSWTTDVWTLSRYHFNNRVKS